MRQWIVILVLVVLLVASNFGWVYYESQFQVTETDTEIRQDTNDGGNNYIVGGDYNGKPNNQDSYTDTNP